MKLHSETELQRKKDEHERKFQRKAADYANFEDERPKKKPRRIGAPQQEYCCSCSTMKTMHGCAASGTCNLCKENDEAGRPFDPNCPICKCKCNIGVFAEKQIVELRIKAEQQKELKTRKKEEDTLKSSVNYLGSCIQSAMLDGAKSLLQSSSTLKRSGGDVRSALMNPLSKGARHYQNSLR
jgi:hypothetical protein